MGLHPSASSAQLAPVYRVPTIVWRRLKCCGKEGVWEHVWRVALSALDR